MSGLTCPSRDRDRERTFPSSSRVISDSGRKPVPTHAPAIIDGSIVLVDKTEGATHTAEWDDDGAPNGDRRAPDCPSGKIGFTKKDARTKKRARERHGSPRLRVYPCPKCQKWHLSRIKPWR